MPVRPISRHPQRGLRRRLRAADLPALLRLPPCNEPRRLQVLLAGRLTAMACPGGGEVQMTATRDALTAHGVPARMWRPWEEPLARADCLHLFGSDPQHLPLVAAARMAGVPVVLSTIAWFDLASYWRQPQSLVDKLLAAGRFLARSAIPALPSWRRRLYSSVDRLLPNSQAEADQLARYFGVDPARISVVPNGASPRFAQADPEPFIQRVGLRDFVLCVGRIEPRKNQLQLLRALADTGLPVVLLGNVVPGHEDYLAACRRAAGRRTRIVEAVAHDDPLLASAYAACRCLALVSWFETPGLAALEAGMSGTPLVLTQGGATREYFGSLAHYVDPARPRQIREAVLHAVQQPRSAALAEQVRRCYSWQAAAAATHEAYRQLVPHARRAVTRPPAATPI